MTNEISQNINIFSLRCILRQSQKKYSVVKIGGKTGFRALPGPKALNFIW